MDSSGSNHNNNNNNGGNNSDSEVSLRKGPTRSKSQKTKEQIILDKRSTMIESIGEKRVVRIFIEETQNNKVSTTNFKSIAIPVPCPAKFCCELLRLKPSVQSVTTEEYRLVEVHDHQEIRVVGEGEEINNLIDQFQIKSSSNEVRKLLFKDPHRLKKVVKVYIIAKKEEMMKSLLVTSTMTVKAVCSLLSSKMKLFDTSRFQFLCQFDQEKSNENNNNNNNNNNNSNEDKYLVTLSKDQILFDFIVNIDRDKKKYKFYFSEPNNLQIQQIIKIGFRIREVKKYEVIGVLGKGGFGRVFKVRELSSGQIFAMKVMKKKLIVEKDMTTHINIELDIMSQVVLSSISSAPLPLLSLEKEDKSRFYASQIVSGLEALHAHNIVYRDLKLENILLDREGNIRLTDFGLSHFLTPEQDVYSFSGTAIYLAPEILNDLPNEKTVDWWCFGVSIYLILCLEPPFWHENHPDLWNEIKSNEPDYAYQTHLSNKSLEFLKALLVKDPKKRLGSSGVEEVKNHPFFGGINWNDVLQKRYAPPFVPSPSSFASDEIHIPKNDLEEVFGQIELEDSEYTMVGDFSKEESEDNSDQFPSFSLLV